MIFILFINQTRANNQDTTSIINENSLKTLLEYCQTKYVINDVKTNITVFLVGEGWDAIHEKKIKHNKKKYKIFKFKFTSNVTIENIIDIMFDKIELNSDNTYKVYVNARNCGQEIWGSIIYEFKNNKLEIIDSSFIYKRE